MRPHQKFYEGDLVKVADDLGYSMDHFTKGCAAIIVHSTLHTKHLSSDETEEHHEYGIMFENGSTSAWYEENQLTLIKERQTDLYNKWMDDRWSKEQELIKEGME